MFIRKKTIDISFGNGMKRVFTYAYSQGGAEFPTGGIPFFDGEPASAPFMGKGGQQTR